MNGFTDYRLTILVHLIISLSVVAAVVALELHGQKIDTTTGTILGAVLGGSVGNAAHAIGRSQNGH